MISYLVSLLMGTAVGAAYGLVQVRAPAPPLIALVGLLGMVLGQQVVGAARHHFTPTAASTRRANGDVQKPLAPVSDRLPNETVSN
jgi:XapX domain-containing protein